MSLPARSGTCRSAIALVRVNRGSTWMIVAPRALASITHWNPTGWHSAMLEPSMTMQSAFCRSCWKVVAPPRPKRGPQTGDGGGVSDPRLVLDLDRAQRGEQLLDQVVLLVVQRRAAEARRSPGCAGVRSPSCLPLPARRCRVSMTRSAIMSIAVSRSRSLPLGAVRPPVEDLVLPRRRRWSAAGWPSPWGTAARG